MVKDKELLRMVKRKCGECKARQCKINELVNEDEDGS